VRPVRRAALRGYPTSLPQLMTNSAGPSQREIVLVAIEGDLDPGEEFSVPLDRPLNIGRSGRGLKVHDPLVSINHARISYNIRRGYVVEDLDSATGTWVDGQCIKGASLPIGVGTILRFGNTSFEVAPSNRIQPWMQAVAAISGGMLLFALLVFVVTALVSDNGVAQRIATHTNKKIHCNGDDTGSLAIPLEFRRKRGLAVSDVSIKQVTDLNKDGCDEVWLEVRERDDPHEVAITFGESFDDWRYLGEFPSTCTLPGKALQPTGPFDGTSMPPIECNGTRWVMGEGQSEYELYDSQGVVVFYNPVRRGFIDILATAGTTAPKGKKVEEGDDPPDASVSYAEQVKVGRFTLADPARFALFLSERGVSEPIHYLICETAFQDAVSAQVLPESKQITEQLNRGCINQLRLVTAAGEPEGRPIAVAFTEPGRRALIDDLTTFFGGNEDGLFLTSEQRSRIDAFRGDPGPLKGSVKLVGDTTTSGVVVFPPAARSTLDPTPRQLVETVGARAAPLAKTFHLLESKPHLTDPPGCADLEIRVNAFTSPGWRVLLPFNFAEAWDKGCSDSPRRLFKTTYHSLGESVHDGYAGPTHVRMMVETTKSGRGIEVIRARIGYRDGDAHPPPLNLEDKLPMQPVSEL